MSVKKNTLWNLMGSAGPLLIGLVAIPYIYNEIGVQRIGVLTIIWALIGYFSIFDFGLGRSITQRIASLTSGNDKERIVSTSTTGVAITFVIGCFGALIGYLLLSIFGVEWIRSDKALTNEIYVSFIISCFAVPITTVTTGMRGILEGLQRFGQVNVMRFALGVSNFLGPVISIFMFGNNLSLIVFSLLIGRVSILIWHIYYTKEFIKLKKEIIQRAEVVKLFQFGGWLTLSNLISPLMVVADRFVISAMLGANVVSYYTIPADFLIRILIIPSAISGALFPVFSAGIASANKTIYTIYKRSLFSIFILMLPIIVILAMFSSWGLELWLGREFAENSSLVASIMSVGIFFNSLAQIPHAYIQASGDAKTTAIIHLFESIFYVPFLIVAITYFGIIGGAIAWSVRALSDLCLLHFYARKKIILLRSC